MQPYHEKAVFNTLYSVDGPGYGKLAIKPRIFPRENATCLIAWVNNSDGGSRISDASIEVEPSKIENDSPDKIVIHSPNAQDVTLTKITPEIFEKMRNQIGFPRYSSLEEMKNQLLT